MNGIGQIGLPKPTPEPAAPAAAAHSGGEAAATTATKKFRVLLPVLIGKRTYEFGETAELDEATAREYSHALLPLEEK